MASMTVQQLLLRIFFAGEIVVFSLVYLFGSNGIAKVRVLERETNVIQQEIIMLESEFDTLNQAIIAWNTHSFYKEKIAREELQFAKEGDEIYYIGCGR